MSLQNSYPNYNSAIQFIIGDKNPVLASNDSKLFSYFVPLKNIKKGFDYYEIAATSKGGVVFSIVTMLGLKTVVRTDSRVITHDLPENQWSDLIFSLATNHFNNDDYVALKRGYVKNSKGCMLMLTIVLGIAISIFI